MKKKILTLMLTLAMTIGLTACTEAGQVRHNIETDANNFNITRTITVFNTRTDTVLFQMTGLMSLSNNEANELVITCEVADGVYKQHYIYLADETTYVMEDVTGTYEDKYHYELNFLPEFGVTITSDD